MGWPGFLQNPKLQNGGTFTTNSFCLRQLTFCKSKNVHVLKQGPPISYSRAREIVHANLSALGLETPTFGLHNIRRGGATSVANTGHVNDRLLKKHGRWKSEFCKDHYIVESGEVRKCVYLKLGI
ncbi:hypothetical protein MAR_035434 [Mya arenaria]|uniref:Tyr recombinase domain-containing protein n=1 Tax=Mya arenaria TaxID=6604 RepID=A0ABY7EP36_MYAAR|nr:hypothetical protein MAR_035434 [Mya arenaria]